MVVLLQADGVFTIATNGRAAAGLHEGGDPGVRRERSQSCRRVKRARAHAHIIRLQDDAAVGAPEIVEGQDHILKRTGWIARARAQGLGGRCGIGCHGARPMAYALTPVNGAARLCHPLMTKSQVLLT